MNAFLGQILNLTTDPVTRMYKSVGASFCKITSSLGGKYSGFISETYKGRSMRHVTHELTNIWETVQTYIQITEHILH